MFVVGVDEAFLHHRTAQTCVWDHAADGTLDEFDWVFAFHDAGAAGAEAAVITGDVVIVLLVFSAFFARELHFGSVDDDDIIAKIKVWGVIWFVFAHEDRGHLGRKAAEGLSRGVDKIPFASNVDVIRNSGLTLHNLFLYFLLAFYAALLSRVEGKEARKFWQIVKKMLILLDSIEYFSFETHQIQAIFLALLTDFSRDGRRNVNVISYKRKPSKNPIVTSLAKWAPTMILDKAVNNVHK